jgi:hypothetical protein
MHIQVTNKRNRYYAHIFRVFYARDLGGQMNYKVNHPFKDGKINFREKDISVITEEEFYVTKKSLPDFCYAMNGEETVLIRNNHDGYYPSTIQAPADELNEKLGVTKQQAVAMKTGAMFGWNTPGARPEAYNEDGKMK